MKRAIGSVILIAAGFLAGSVAVAGAQAEEPDLHGHRAMQAEIDALELRVDQLQFAIERGIGDHGLRHERHDKRLADLENATSWLNTEQSRLKDRIREHGHNLPDPGHCVESRPSTHYDDRIVHTDGTEWIERYRAVDIACENWPAMHIEGAAHGHERIRHIECVDLDRGAARQAWLDGFVDYCQDQDSISRLHIRDADGWAVYDPARHGTLP